MVIYHLRALFSLSFSLSRSLPLARIFQVINQIGFNQNKNKTSRIAALDRDMATDPSQKQRKHLKSLLYDLWHS